MDPNNHFTFPGKTRKGVLKKVVQSSGNYALLEQIIVFVTKIRTLQSA